MLLLISENLLSPEPVVVLMRSSSRIDGPGRRGLPKQQSWSNEHRDGVQSFRLAADNILDEIAGSGKFSDADFPSKNYFFLPVSLKYICHKQVIVSQALSLD